MRFRFFKNLSSPKAQRQVEKVGGRVLSIITYPFRLLIQLGKDTGHVLAGWWESRNLRYLLQGLPALVVAIAIIVVGALVFFQDRSALAQEYKDLAFRAQADTVQAYRTGQSTKEAGALAQTCYKYLGIHPPNDTKENSYHMGEVYALMRQDAAAYGIFEKLAPLDPKVLGYGPAHLEVARRMLPPYRPGTKIEDQQRILLEAENHLRRAVQFDLEGRDPRSSAARALLFDVLRITNRPEEAEQFLRDAVRFAGNSQPQYRRVLASWYLQQGKRDLAEREMEQAVDAYSKRLQETFGENDSRLLYIDSLRVLGKLRYDRGDFKKGKDEFARAKEACHSGRVMAGDPDMARRYKFAYYAILLAQYDSSAAEIKSIPNPERTPQLVEEQKKISLERFALLNEALNLFPNHRDVLEKLSIYLREGTPDEVERAKKAIEDNIAAGGQDSAIGHMILGTEAYRKNDMGTAKYHWDMAVKLNPEGIPQVTNNLAWLLSDTKPYDFDRALMLVNKALDAQPRSEFRSTRGHILKKMGRTRDAYPDLQEGLKVYAKDPVQGPRLYDALIEVATDLGLKGDADQYKRAKEELLRTAPRRQGSPAAAPAQPADNKASPAGTPEKKDANKDAASAPPK
jgi:tetratricopeptide (TPR) repeat protein